MVTSVILTILTRPEKGTSSRPLLLQQTLFILSVLLAGAVMLIWKSDYILEMLDINSTSRGISSGGTGRFKNWADFITIIQDQPLVIFFGHGFRSWPAKMGFDSDNSYITLIYEIGLPLTMIITFLLVRGLISAIRKFDSKTMSPEIIAVLSFSLIESIFARYLVSIGNPASFIFLVAFLAVQLPRLDARRAVVT